MFLFVLGYFCLLCIKPICYVKAHMWLVFKVCNELGQGRTAPHFPVGFTSVVTSVFLPVHAAVAAVCTAAIQSLTKQEKAGKKPTSGIRAGSVEKGTQLVSSHWFG